MEPLPPSATLSDIELKPLDLLLRFIDEANLVSGDIDLPDIDLLYEKYTGEANFTESDKIMDIDIKFHDSMVSAFKEATQEIPPSTRESWYADSLKNARYFQRNASDLELETSAMYWAFSLYKDFRQRRSDLRAIATFFAQRRAKVRYPEFFFPKIATTLRLSGTTLIIELLGLARALHGIDGDRIRICKICDKLFWALRRDSEACSLSCSNVLRVRKSRAKSKSEVQEKRRSNYRHNKRVKAKRSQRNGDN